MIFQSKKSPDPLAPPLAAPFLFAELINAQTFIRHVEIHDTLDSTNNRAAELSRDNHVELPALIAARLQTAGRGRGAKKWWSADGALTFSLLVDPAAHGIETANWPQLSLTTAVAVCDALEAGSMERRAKSEDEFPTPSSLPPTPCSIKWPNDVLVAGRKIAGILLESPGGAAPAKDRLIIGIGVNVNNSWHTAPSDLTALCSALCDVTGRTHNLQQLLADLLSAFQRRVSQLAATDPQLPTAWQQLCCLTHRDITVTNNGRRTTGRCLGIGSDGTLLIRSDFGTERMLSGSVHVI